jgi:mRNA interferase MazF
MSDGDIVLFAFQQADGQVKNRPSVVLRSMPPFGDLLVCGISRQLHQQVHDFDEIIALTDGDFKASGLTGPSLIRLGFLALIPEAEVVRVIGRVNPDRHRRLVRRLADFLAKE